MASIKNIIAPDFGVPDVSVIEVLVKPGDVVKKDTPLMTLESDKATMELPSTDAGVVKELKVKVGDKISVGTVILTLESAEPEGADKPAAKPAEQVAPASKEVPETVPKPGSPSPATAPTALSEAADAQVHAGPGVRRLARELGVNLSQVSGTGPKQRILQEDVHAYVKKQLTQLQSGGMAAALPPAPVVDFAKFGEIETKALSRIKKISGKNLQRNWMSIPHVTQFGDADMTDVETLRKNQKEAMEKQGIKLTPLVFIMKAVVDSLKLFPQFNASLDASGENLILKKYFHIGVAVDTPDGLVVPVIKDVDKKSVVDLAKELGTVSEKARNKQLLPVDMQGGCFSISSLGGIGGTAFTPIINAPEVAILGVSKSFYKPVYQPDGTFVARFMLPLSLSYDHRVVDGADGARFITQLSKVLSDIKNFSL